MYPIISKYGLNDFIDKYRLMSNPYLNPTMWSFDEEGTSVEDISAATEISDPLTGQHIGLVFPLDKPVYPYSANKVLTGVKSGVFDYSTNVPTIFGNYLLVPEGTTLKYRKGYATATFIDLFASMFMGIELCNPSLAHASLQLVLFFRSLIGIRQVELSKKKIPKIRIKPYEL